jgi:hypothetical protein
VPHIKIVRVQKEDEVRKGARQAPSQGQSFMHFVSQMEKGARTRTPLEIEIVDRFHVDTHEAPGHEHENPVQDLQAI